LKMSNEWQISCRRSSWHLHRPPLPLSGLEERRAREEPGPTSACRLHLRVRPLPRQGYRPNGHQEPGSLGLKCLLLSGPKPGSVPEGRIGVSLRARRRTHTAKTARPTTRTMVYPTVIASMYPL
jgi:hypothetical protein